MPLGPGSRVRHTLWTHAEAEKKRATILAALRGAEGNVTRTAEALGCTRSTLYVWASKLQLHREFGLGASGNGTGAEPVPTSQPVPKQPELRRSVSVKLRAGTWKRTRHAALDRECTVSELVELALEKLLAETDPATAAKK